MRYELYRYDEELEWYEFVNQDDFIEHLYAGVLMKGIVEDFYKIKNRKGKWIFIDNEPTEFNILDYGYQEIPTNKEIRERILYCKFSKHFNKKDMRELFKGDKLEIDIFNQEYEKTMQIASQETDAICSSLFFLTPIKKLPLTNKVKKA